MKLTAIFQNDILICCLISWAVAQILKAVIYTIRHKKFEWERLFGDGGMPSCHSAFVSALALSTALVHGFDSSLFAIAAAFAIVVMHDAAGVRLESGKQAHAINEILEVLKTQQPLQKLTKLNSLEVLEELLGHTPLQVINGCIIGIVTSVIYF